MPDGVNNLLTRQSPDSDMRGQVMVDARMIARAITHVVRIRILPGLAAM